MASTFDNNLRLAEMATGDQDGTWGTQTNTNLSLITDAFKYGSEAIANASSDTITLANATADDARSFYLKCTGGGQACTVTLAPNTVSKVWIIENATSYTLTFSQGSGANIAVAAGATKMIVTDGGGSSAAVYDALEDLALGGTPTATNLTVTSSVTADSVTAPTLTGSTSVKTPLIEYTDGDDAITIADGGGITAAAGITSTAAANTFGATSFNDADITNVGNISVDGVLGDADSDTAMTFSTDNTIRFQCGGNSQLIISDGVFYPHANNDVDLGSSSYQFKDAYFDGTVTTDSITNSGAIYSGSFVYSSDVSLKEDIQTIENPLEKVQALRGVSYKWKDTGRKDIGLVANEVEEVLPELVVEKGHKHIDYGHMIGLLVEAMKEQQKEIEELKNA
jgi:hypothetical protein|tara:strand:- start:1738 stop:2925 length:1188 start_codon:yes stop_codon:yes gene_type:complete